MEDIVHPSALILPRWLTIIRGNAMQAGREGILVQAQLDLIYQQQWFKLLVPKAYGGLEIPLPDLIRLEEALSWADGSFGWVVTLCAGAGWFGAFIEPQLARRIFSDPKVCLAGSGASTGSAERTADEYILNGNWKYASGVKHATHFTVNCVIKQHGETMPNANGLPTVLPFVIDKKNVELIPAWKYMGMIGTGSHAFKIESLSVNAAHCFEINPETVIIDNRLYHYPFLQLAEATLAANLSGMAIHFVDLCEPIFREKIDGNKLNHVQKDTLIMELQQARDNLQMVRNSFYQAVDASWEDAGQVLREPGLQKVSTTSRLLAKISRETVDKLYPYCGLLAASPDTELNQVWRDLHTASQHSLLTYPE